jgi:uncharacterized protein (TIGR03084 family)
MSGITEVLDALAEQHAELDAVLDGLDEVGWHRPTRCEGWDVADVVLHLAQTDELALASAHGRFADGITVLARGVDGSGTVDDGAAATVAKERGVPIDALHARWQAGAASIRTALAATDPHARVDWVAGRLSVHTLAATRLAECWIHTGDVADAVELILDPADRLEHVARLAWRTLPYAFSKAGRELSGPVAFSLRAPSGAHWDFRGEGAAANVVEGPGIDLCLVAARRVTPEQTALRASGPDAPTVLELVRTYA